MKLELAGITKSYGSQKVLDVPEVALENIHCLAVIGPSGGGKSTLLRILAGLVYPDGGECRINGAPVIFHEAALLKHRRSLGIVFQAFNLFPHLTALENILLPLERAHGKPRAVAETLARQLLERFRLEGHADKVPAQLSGGQKQRVALVRALAAQPQVLLLDEPTSALDPEMTAEVLEMIAALKQDLKDLIVVTHEMGFARKAADHVLFIAEGRVLESGPARDVFERPRTETCRRFLDKILKF